ncbi:hypothetical protein CMU95_05300 [Elizabethkingia anophelis]|nr:hypothetical protein [Elizabethkingia anophelis]MDV2461361.1 hypothetical protein [Elizabethkingia anophelis]MDV3476712.1 hypothetical protein [Elizabethkingia anophelis]
MELKILKPKESNLVSKITVHKTGKLGFSKGAMEQLNLHTNKFCKFGMNENDELFIIVSGEKDDETYNIAKAGDYYYVSAKALLEDDLNIDYRSKSTTIFDLFRTEDKNIMKMIKRVISR